MMLAQEMTLLNIQLRDGAPVLLRPVLPEDRQRLQHGLLLMSAESRYRRFFSPMPAFSEEQLRYFTEVDQENHVAWIALDPSAPGLPGLGIARFIRNPDEPTMAEWLLQSHSFSERIGKRVTGNALSQAQARASKLSGRWSC